jgi:hypothetical protein
MGLSCNVSEPDVNICPILLLECCDSLSGKVVGAVLKNPPVIVEQGEMKSSAVNWSENIFIYYVHI